MIAGDQMGMHSQLTLGAVEIYGMQSSKGMRTFINNPSIDVMISCEKEDGLSQGILVLANAMIIQN